ncbi:MAG: VWA domain-containing protein [Planctomycetota bacterium]|nr:VWA domain-containing protein [Planctomycetota bacterium]
MNSTLRIPAFEERIDGYVNRRRRRWRRSLHGLAFVPALLGATILLRTEASTPADPALETSGTEIVVCLDVSRSMLARDVAPSRLARAHAEIRALAEAAPTDRISLVAFAGEARLIVPPTLDGSLLADLAELCGPSSVARGGSDLGAGLEAAAAVLPESLDRRATVLVLTDGEDLEGRGARVAAELAQRGVTVHCVGFGSERGSKIVVAGSNGEQFLRDASGREVVSVLDAAALRTLARVTGGDYFAAGTEAGMLRAIYTEQVLPQARRAALDSATTPRTLSTLLLSLAAALWILVLATRDGIQR